MLRILLISFFSISLFFPFSSRAQVISGPDVKINDNAIYVTFSLELDDKKTDEIKKGIDKELELYIDLFRVWKVWPDEFVTGKSYLRTLRSDPIKKEYVATSNDGAVLIERRFRSFESMLDWTLSVKDLQLANIKELDPASYFIKVTIESKIRELPPVIGHFLIFVPENEFKIMKDSNFFAIEENR